VLWTRALQLRDPLGPGGPVRGREPHGNAEPVGNTIIGGDAAIKIEPRNTVEAELSVRFRVAFTLLRGAPDLSAYGLVGDATVTELSHRITVVTDPARPNCSAAHRPPRERRGGDRSRRQAARTARHCGVLRVPGAEVHQPGRLHFTGTGVAAIITAGHSLVDGGSVGQLAAALSPKQDPTVGRHGESADAGDSVR
jgi:hypothetical protein